MVALLRKEITAFFSSITGYLVLIVFLTVVGLYMWVFPGDMNILDAGFSSIDTLFVISPWVFLFLVPAITMRLFAEEKKTGTLEMLLTKPLTEWQIVIAKYLAGFVLVLLALLPTVVYFVTVQYFISPHNMDVGGTIGSYVGLVFLSAIYTAIGLWTSSLTNNQIIAFVLGMALAFFFYAGFQYISELSFMKPVAQIIDYIGINSHYQSISRGVIDTKDLVYFLSAIFIFLYLSKFGLEKRKWN